MWGLNPRPKATQYRRLRRATMNDIHPSKQAKVRVRESPFSPTVNPRSRILTFPSVPGINTYFTTTPSPAYKGMYTYRSHLEKSHGERTWTSCGVSGPRVSTRSSTTHNKCTTLSGVGARTGTCRFNPPPPAPERTGVGTGASATSIFRAALQTLLLASVSHCSHQVSQC